MALDIVGFNDGSLLGSDNVAYHNNKTVEQVLDDLQIETDYNGYIYFKIGDFAIELGKIYITPVKDTPTKGTVVFPKPFKEAPFVLVSANSTVPGTIKELTPANQTPTGTDIYVNRSGTGQTSITWLAIGPAT